MCGIIASIERGGFAPTTVFNGLKQIDYRGYDSWGIAYQKDQGLEVIKRVGSLPENYFLPRSPLAIGHTRWATHGEVTVINAHPHLDCAGKLAIVHNGIIENYTELKKSLVGHKIVSETDTEVLIHVAEDRFKENGGDLLDAAAYSYSRISGANSLIIADRNNFVALRNITSLVLAQLPDGFAVASDTQALLDKTNKFYFLNNEAAVLVSQDQIPKVYKLPNLAPFRISFSKIQREENEAEKLNFPHFMIKEISEQPEILKKISRNETEVRKVGEFIREAFGTFFIACGSAAYAAQEGVYLFSKIAKKHVNFSVGSEFIYLQDYLTDKSLLVAVSQSGESVDTVEPTIEAKKKGVKIVSLVNKVGSELFRLSDYPLSLQAGLEKAVCSTKVVTAMLANMIMIAHSLAGSLEEGQEIVRKSAEEVNILLDKTQAINELAEHLKNVDHVYCLGRGLSYPVAMEASLKIKEVTYIHSEGFAGGELKHGVIALIEQDSPVIVFAPNDETRDAVLSNAMEVKSRGAYVIGVGSENSPIFNSFFEVKEVGASSIIPNVVFAQLLAYYLATKKGYDPDKPRNLAKSVVVR